MSDIKPIQPTINAHDAALIQRALEALPATCRYHGDQIDGTGWRARDACCETGRPALRRRQAEDALKRSRGDA